ncbi:flagellar basal-body rod protein FlgF [Oceaniovalibus guishaninsula JLT2003]|uniref:Flagellar basal-body rod protein FlgF n=1 Tax=Oceaniovalibus guishaninsula JLT2003 TaxID=1231392 RepID=K2GM19_9RHOB|nr:flagellar hook-basal body complex protein [Oceaniovalibus guishaninsula]EKE43776.1 flagellar basal-body rod protein FlgF [Oceaniovalibus guishaninsula JLT2003]
MDNIGYTALTRQSGLMREMQSVAHNIANMGTGGYRKEGLLFSEHIEALGRDQPSLSMAQGNVRRTSYIQGAMEQTGGAFDLAIQGDGFFLVETEDGQALTRAGNFTPSPEGDLVTPDGLRLLDAGGAPVFAPPGAQIAIAADGTVSADGQPLTQIGLWRAVAEEDMTRRSGVAFDLAGAPEPVEDATILQGFLEGSNVDPVGEIARMIEVQRAYELGQSFLEKEDERIRGVLTTLGR